MDIRKPQRIIVDALVEIKGKDIVVFNTEKLTDQFSRAVFASGTSNRHTVALAENVKEKVKAAGGIRTADAFLDMVRAGATRIGCSAGIPIIEELKRRFDAEGIDAIEL